MPKIASGRGRTWRKIRSFRWPLSAWTLPENRQGSDPGAGSPTLRACGHPCRAGVSRRDRLVESAAESDRARRLLAAKYPQFAGDAVTEAAGPVMAIDIRQRAGWSYS
jgi:hypothetical protein